MSCDVGKAREGLENELWRRWSDGELGGWAELIVIVIAELILQHFRLFTYVTTHSLTLPLLHLRHSSFYNPSPTSPSELTHRRSHWYQNINFFILVYREPFGNGCTWRQILMSFLPGKRHAIYPSPFQPINMLTKDFEWQDQLKNEMRCCHIYWLSLHIFSEFLSVIN